MALGSCQDFVLQGNHKLPDSIFFCRLIMVRWCHASLTAAFTVDATSRVVLLAL